MSDEKIETGAKGDHPAGKPDLPGDDDRNTDIFAPQVEGGQPAVGDDRPRNTEF